jgi:hypothetical protein
MELTYLNWSNLSLEGRYKGVAYLLKGAYSLDKALNTKARLSAAKMVENIEKIYRECELGTSRSACNEPHMHE